MNWILGMLIAVFLGAAIGEVEARSSAQPGLVIVCEVGGVTHDISHVASGSQCVLHDRSGSATSAGAISVYDDSEAVP